MHNRTVLQTGWIRVILYSIFSLVLIFSCSIAARQFVVGDESSRESQSLIGFIAYYLIVTVVLVGLAFLFRKYADRQSFISLGLFWKGYQNNAIAGALLGILILCAGAMVLVLLQFLFFTGTQLDALGLLYSFIFFVLVAFTEEIAFRGYILSNLMQSTNKWVALIISALMFALFHANNSSISVIGMLNIFVAGILLGINYIFTKNLWFAIFLHFSWNFFQGPVLGFEVSGFESSGIFLQVIKGPEWLTGGGFGFEGSFICLLLNTAACFLLGFYYSKNNIPVPKTAIATAKFSTGK